MARYVVESAMSSGAFGQSMEAAVCMLTIVLVVLSRLVVISMYVAVGHEMITRLVDHQ